MSRGQLGSPHSAKLFDAWSRARRFQTSERTSSEHRRHPWRRYVPDHISLWGLRLAICQGFDQGVCVRPARLLPGVSSPLRSGDDRSIDFVVVGENAEGASTRASVAERTRASTLRWRSSRRFTRGGTSIASSATPSTSAGRARRRTSSASPSPMRAGMPACCGTKSPGKSPETTRRCVGSELDGAVPDGDSQRARRGLG